MANTPEVTSMALFCDFENVALGVRDAKYAKFDIGKVLERLLLKGSIVVKKAYCDWDRYKAFKAPMHEASFELIEIPHVRQSGKNSADIRMVVDALDLCYTKAHVDTFVIISGDSDFSPLVSKLRENDKTVIGVGVKNSTSDLLIANCDEFIYYDDLVRAKKKAATRGAAKRGTKRSAAKNAATPARSAVAATHAATRSDAGGGRVRCRAPRRRRAHATRRSTWWSRRSTRCSPSAATTRQIWGSMVKQALKRRKPGFNESYYGFRSFNELLEEAARAASSRSSATRNRAATSFGSRPATTEPTPPSPDKGQLDRRTIRPRGGIRRARLARIRPSLTGAIDNSAELRRGQLRQACRSCVQRRARRLDAGSRHPMQHRLPCAR